MVKEYLDILLPSIITKLVNCSLFEVVVPAGFKNVVGIPLQNASLPPDDFQELPTCGLHFISKLLEQVVVSQLNDNVSSKGLENIKQPAYKLGPSTETVLLLINNDVHLLWLEVSPPLLCCSTNRQHLTQLIMAHS